METPWIDHCFFRDGMGTGEPWISNILTKTQSCPPFTTKKPDLTLRSAFVLVSWFRLGWGSCFVSLRSRDRRVLYDLLARSNVEVWDKNKGLGYSLF